MEKYASVAETDALENALPLILRNQSEITIVQKANTSSVDKITIDLISYSELARSS